MRRVLINISVSAASLLLSLGVVEVFLRLFTVASFQFVDPSFFGDDNWFEFHPDLRYTLRKDHTRTVSYRNDDCGQTSIEIVTNGAGVRDRFPQSGHGNPFRTSTRTPRSVSSAFSGFLFGNGLTSPCPLLVVADFDR